MPSAAVHLLVIAHGLWGETKHVAQLAKEAQERCAAGKTPSSIYDAPPIASMQRRISVGFVEPSEVKLVVYLSKSNEGTQTYDGIDRVCDEIDAEVKRIEEAGEGIVKRFSIVGYSLGGLIARYVIGLLDSRSPSFFDSVRPVNFATFASPALGVVRMKGAFRGFIFWSGARLLSRTGRQIHGKDRFQGQKPLLEVMAEPDSSFMAALSSFERIEIYANVTKDRTVPYASGGMSWHDPFGEAVYKAQKQRKAAGISDELLVTDLREGGLELTMDPKYPPIITKWQKCDPIAPDVDASTAPSKRNIVPRFLRPSSYPWWPKPVRYIVVCAFPVAVPLWFLFLTCVFAVQSRKSYNRLRLLRQKAGLENREARLTRVGLRDKVDEVVDVAMRETDESSTLKLEIPDDLCPLDPLISPGQQRMIKHLEAIPQMRRHLVYFTNGWNSHAMIVCRDPDRFPDHGAGRQVLRHWCDGFRL